MPAFKSPEHARRARHGNRRRPPACVPETTSSSASSAETGKSQFSDSMRAWMTKLGHVHEPKVARSQHSYQQLAFVADHVEGLAPRLTTTMVAGVLRLQLSVPGRLRLVRYRFKSKWSDMKAEASRTLRSRKTRRSLGQALPLLLLVGLTAACSLVGGDDSSGENLSLGPLPELSKNKKTRIPSTRRKDAPWTYVLPVDHGVRADRSGQGHFRAPRFHGEHNGLDLLAPIGTPVFAPCSGKAMSGVSQSFGYWVHLICPVPDQFAEKGKPHPWVSFFYAHLNRASLKHNQWVEVSSSEQVGEVGKSGNARGDSVKPHLHLELIVQRNRRSAMDERHLGADQSSVAAAERFSSVLNRECMQRYGFDSKNSHIRRARRIDPFIALTCLSDFKPNFQKAPSPLTGASRAWTQFYVAKDFNVNLGVEDSALAKR